MSMTTHPNAAVQDVDLWFWFSFVYYVKFMIMMTGRAKFCFICQQLSWSAVNLLIPLSSSVVGLGVHQFLMIEVEILSLRNAAIYYILLHACEFALAGDTPQAAAAAGIFHTCTAKRFWLTISNWGREIHFYGDVVAVSPAIVPLRESCVINMTAFHVQDDNGRLFPLRSPSDSAMLQSSFPKSSCQQRVVIW